MAGIEALRPRPFPWRGSAVEATGTEPPKLVRIGGGGIYETFDLADAGVIETASLPLVDCRRTA